MLCLFSTTCNTGDESISMDDDDMGRLTGLHTRVQHVHNISDREVDLNRTPVLQEEEPYSYIPIQSGDEVTEEIDEELPSEHFPSGNVSDYSQVLVQ